MAKIWMFVCACCFVYSIISGQTGNVLRAVLACGDEAIRLTVALCGNMMLWCGLLEILQEAGAVDRMSRLLRRVLTPLFPSNLDDDSWNAIALNLSANMLGLGNAATPAGLRAAEVLSKQGSRGIQALIVLLVLNNSSVQIVPTTVISLRATFHAAVPADIWLPTLIASAVTTFSAVLMIKWLLRKKEA